jgi:hypothetical protein
MIEGPLIESFTIDLTSLFCPASFPSMRRELPKTMKVVLMVLMSGSQWIVSSVQHLAIL